MPVAPLPDLREAGFNSYEVPVIRTLHWYLRDDTRGPLLTNNEEDIRIPDDTIFFDNVSQTAVPQDAVQKLWTGELTREEIVRKQQIARNMTRREKSTMFVDRIITATVAVDTCRALFRATKGAELVPVLEDDDIETVTHRVGDYVTDLLVGGRQTPIIRHGRESRVLRNAAMDRLTQTVRSKFDTHPEAAVILTGLAGQNSRKKVLHYAKELKTVSKNYDRMNTVDKARLDAYMASRPETYQNAFDLYPITTAEAS